MDFLLSFMYNYIKKRAKMNIVNKIQIAKAVTHKTLTQKESEFLFSIINKTNEMGTAVDFMKTWISNSKNKIQVNNFSYNEHQTLSSSIISKLKNEIITIEDLEEIIK